MNERIKELIKQATTIEEHKWGVSYDKFDKEKFAELIVRECISIARDRAAFDWAPPNDVNHIIDEIKEHFGVEE